MGDDRSVVAGIADAADDGVVVERRSRVGGPFSIPVPAGTYEAAFGAKGRTQILGLLSSTPPP